MQRSHPRAYQHHARLRPLPGRHQRRYRQCLRHRFRHTPVYPHHHSPGHERTLWRANRALTRGEVLTPTRPSTPTAVWLIAGAAALAVSNPRVRSQPYPDQSHSGQHPHARAFTGHICSDRWRTPRRQGPNLSTARRWQRKICLRTIADGADQRSHQPQGLRIRRRCPAGRTYPNQS